MGITLLKGKIRFDRHELAGSFGDIGTDFPLIVGMILACPLDPTSVLVIYGLMQILTGLIYGIPMPVQPLKAMAVIVITQKLSGNVLYGAGLAIGIMMAILILTGIVGWIARIVPKSVVRGIQFGLGLQLSLLALKEYVPADGAAGYALAFLGFVLVIIFLRHKKYPAALSVIALGLIYAMCFRIDSRVLTQNIGFRLPGWHVPQINDILTGLVVLAVPQICLSIGNSILATRQLAQDYFPEKKMTIKKIGITYSMMNLVSPFFGGIPVCHGSGGMAGHYTFGARTGGSTLIYGSIYLCLGLFFSQGFGEVIKLFPKPILGVILLFEGWAMMRLIRDIDVVKDLGIVFLIGVLAIGLPYGYLIGLLAGTILVNLRDRKIINSLDSY